MSPTWSPEDQAGRQERLKHLSQFEVVFLTPSMVTKFDAVFKAGSGIDTYLFQAWRELKRAVAADRSVVASVLGNHLVSGVPKIRSGTRQPPTSDRVDLMGDGWRKLFAVRDAKKKDQEEKAKETARRKVERDRKVEEVKIEKEQRMAERKRKQEERDEQDAIEKISKLEEKKKKQEEREAVKQRKNEEKENKEREAKSKKKDQRKVVPEGIGSKMITQRIRPVFKAPPRQSEHSQTMI